MRLLEVERKARSVGIRDTWKYAKTELIKRIQCSEGYSPCFGTDNKSCAHMDCCWKDDCLK
ncbi:MAG: SAP domain-containing protein [Candidatus Omnitrophota bacterium]